MANYKIDGAHTPGPYRAPDSHCRDSDARDDMADYRAVVYAAMPYREALESDRPGELIPDQVVGAAYGRTPEEVRANQLLFAAAPDMAIAVTDLILWARKVTARRDPKAREEAIAEWPAIEKRVLAVRRAALRSA